jgi:hypothetical protein
MLELRNESNGSIMFLPTKRNELNFDYISKCVENIDLEPYYAIICCINNTQLNIMYAKSKANSGYQASTTPLIVKMNNPNADSKLKENTIAIVDSTQLSIGSHINSKRNELSANNICNFVDADRSLSMSVTNGSVFKNVSQGGAAGVIKSLVPDVNAILPKHTIDATQTSRIFYLEFKIVPVNEIKGCFNNEGVELTGVDSYIKNANGSIAFDA